MARVEQFDWPQVEHFEWPSGGVRVIYYFHDEAMPLYLLTLFAKGDQANLSKSERNDLAGLVKLLVQIWKGKPT